MRFASIITYVLFVIVVIIALMNILVAVAVRGDEELMEYGQIYHLWNQVHLLYEWHEVQSFFFFPSEFVMHSLKSRSTFRLRHDK